MTASCGCVSNFFELADIYILAPACIFTKVDLLKAFFQVLLTERSQAFTSFTDLFGHSFVFLVCPLGISNVPAWFQHVMRHTLGDTLGVQLCVLWL